MTKKKRVWKSKTKKHRVPEIIGKIRISSRGIGFVIDPKTEKEIEIGPKFLNTALHGDEVAVFVHPIKGKYRATGEVLSIVKRKKMGFSGILNKGEGIHFVKPVDPKMYTTILIPDKNLNGAKVGDKVFVEINSWKKGDEPPYGIVERVLGGIGHESDMRGIVLEYGFDYKFPEKIEAEAEKIKKEFKISDEVKNRKDIRGKTTFTIDPEDAKDFDDALSFEKIDDETFEVGIHIADVSHFVTPKTEIDKEAKDRATSIYMVDRTIPMLPEILSNDLCSLNPNEDKLAFSAIFKLDMLGRVKSSWFGRTVINSDKRFTYEEAQKVLDDKSGLYFEELNILNEIAKNLKKERVKRGSILVDQEEVKFELDENGKPRYTYLKRRTDTNFLIEEFMLLANKKVTEFVVNKSKKKDSFFVYRVHDKPEKKKMESLIEFLKLLNYKPRVIGGTMDSIELNRIIKKAEGTNEEDLIETAIVRSMQKAIYSIKNIGHFGLGFKNYTHFTSPIRRYPDLMVHRLLQKYLDGVKIEKEEKLKIANEARHSSEKEREAQEAERDSIKYKQVEYMSDRIGETFNGVISGVSDWAMFIAETKTKAEGVVRLRDLNDDYYVFDEKRRTIIGEKTKTKYRLGDSVKIKLKSVDLERKTIDYTLIK